MRFLADMGVSPEIATWLRARDHDVAHLRDQGLHRLPDPEVFRKAALESRVLLTFDLDFGEVAALSGAARPSVVVFRLRNPRTAHVIARLGRVLAAIVPALEGGAIVVIEDGRHRVRRLPIGG